VTILAQIVAADSCCCTFNGSDLLHSSQLSRLESCTVYVPDESVTDLHTSMALMFIYWRFKSVVAKSITLHSRVLFAHVCR
jgi:hypothetical protein